MGDTPAPRPRHRRRRLRRVRGRGHPAAAPAPELHVTLLRALATLPVRDQAIVVLRHWEDHSVDTVAEILGITPSVVKMQTMRALSRLRDLLGEDFAHH